MTGITTTRDEEQPPTKAPEVPPKKSTLREYAEAFVVAILLALVIRTFVVQAFKIPSGSMLPTLQIGDHILVNKFIYWLRAPGRGDVVVFKFPQDETRDFIKRVIGLPGETIEVRGERAIVDGRPLREPYAVHTDPVAADRGLAPRDWYGPVRVPPGHLFVMGDNRDHSMDSRFWGFLEVQKIKGRAFIIYWSWDKDRFRVRWDRIGKVLH